MKKDKKQSWFKKVSDVAKYKKMYNTIKNEFETVNEKYVATLEKRVEKRDEEDILRASLKKERAKNRKLKYELAKLKTKLEAK